MGKVFTAMLVVFIFIGSSSHRAGAQEAIKEEEGVHSFTLNDIDGKPVDLSEYKGKILLVVNTASRCGYTNQYKSLQELYERYQDKGFVVLGFPANNFMGQEPGSNEEIKKFCSLKFNVSFPMFAKISVKGDDIHPLYRYLTNRPGMQGAIGWNFNKFIVDAKGQVIARYGSGVDPLSEEITKVIEGLLK